MTRYRCNLIAGISLWLLCTQGAWAAASAPAGPSRHIVLPDHIPAQCVTDAAQRYQVPEVALLAILKQESGGQAGINHRNSNGSIDWGPAQLNSRSWGRVMRDRYGISPQALTNNMCQAIMAQAYVLRSEWDACRKDGQKSIWCAIARYHSPTPALQEKYVRHVWEKYQSMMARGHF